MAYPTRRWAWMVLKAPSIVPGRGEAAGYETEAAGPGVALTMPRSWKVWTAWYPPANPVSPVTPTSKTHSS